MRSDYRRLLKNISNPDGICMEECAELIQAINKMARFPFDAQNKYGLINEMADVLICFELLKLRYDITDDQINTAISSKMSDNMCRIAIEEENVVEEGDEVEHIISGQRGIVTEVFDTESGFEEHVKIKDAEGHEQIWKIKNCTKLND